MSLVGSTTTTGAVARLTDGGFFEAGALWDHKTVDSSQDWRTTFRLQMTPNAGRADGVAFVVQEAGLAALGGEGGGMGYAGLSPSVAVEFDIYRNYFDPDNNHVAITTSGVVEEPAGVGGPGIDLAGDSFRAWITYDAKAHHMKVYVSQGDVQSTVPAVEADINVPDTFPDRLMFVGFTAATGSETAVQDLQSWSFSGWPAQSLFGGSPIDVLSADPKTPGGKGCTAGFAVVKHGIPYMLTADHCRADHPTIGVYPPENRSTPYMAFANCTGSDPACLVPPAKAKPDDMMAWKPDTVELANVVQTGEGLLPVLGSADWKKNERVCWWGRTTGFEVCGNILGFNKGGPGTVRTRYVKMSGQLVQEGDSGGPVYVYVRDANGIATAVRAIGIVEQTGGNVLTGEDWSEFLPIVTAKMTLGIRVLGRVSRIGG